MSQETREPPGRRHRPGERRGHAGAARLLRRSRPASRGRPVDGREPDRAVGARVGVGSRRLALFGPARPRPSLPRARDAGGGGTAGRLPQQSRPHGRGGGGRLDLCRAAGDEPRRGGERASAFGLRDPLHHGGRGGLHGRRRAQDDPRRERLRADPERHLARARGRGDRQRPCIWQDGLDIPFVNAMEANFYEVHPDLRQAVAFEVDDTTRTWGNAGLTPSGG